ncbi:MULTISPECIES: hypothetical protein [Bacillus]|uniref:Lipoprotein n=1 Tax=Bacillus cereus TaxID=1396 RepID=A0A9X6SUU7_BACCE|nr:MULTISPECIES: hypothetical protein [Bacillus]KAF6697974.1 hypothetical protein HFD78_18370 [Bacillus sp. EKM501B]KMP50403.1 hypothetical protein TU59_21030 [Bacillus cereus]MCI4054850.1 hypothetical protein [Bacillus cereus]MCS6592772.1 hypothetical protein [Bacillus cereus]MDF3554782.1 hypothetical protein [Bacillus cereus]
MNLIKIKVTALCFVLFLSACSPAQNDYDFKNDKDGYLEAVAEKEYLINKELEEVEDTSISVDERKKYIDKAISIMKEAKKISAPSEYKTADKEYEKYLDLFAKLVDEAKGNLKNVTAVHKSFSEKDLEKLVKQYEAFEKSLGSDAKESLIKKQREHRRVTQEEYIDVVRVEIRKFYDCFGDGKLSERSSYEIKTLEKNAREHLYKISGTVPPKKFDDAEKKYREAEKKFHELLDLLYFDPEMKESKTAEKVPVLFDEGMKLNNEFMDMLIKDK